MRSPIKTALLTLLFAINTPLNADLAAAGGTDYRIPVTAITAEKESIRQLTRVQGVVEAVDAPELKSKVAAEVVAVLVEEGDSVQAGQVLARLDDEGFRLDKQGAEADIQRLQALLETQRRTLERDDSLFRQKLISDAKLDDARSAVKQTRAQLAHARSLLAKTEYQLSHTRVRSPIDGIIQYRNISVGDYVNPNSPSSKPLFQVVDRSHLRARLYFPENLAHQVRAGTPVRLLKGDLQVDGQVDILRPMLESGNRSQHALVGFDNRHQWRPGESITAQAELARNDQAVVVPAGVLVRRPAGLVVYRLQGESAEEVVVMTGIREGGRVEIVEGIEAGDRLVQEGAHYLGNGVAVSLQGESK
jgi:membrane fusion protein (multidrug efflux system)